MHKALQIQRMLMLNAKAMLLHRHSQVTPYQYICSPVEAPVLHKPKFHAKGWFLYWRMHENLASLTGRTLQSWPAGHM